MCSAPWPYTCVHDNPFATHDLIDSGISFDEETSALAGARSDVGFHAAAGPPRTPGHSGERIYGNPLVDIKVIASC